MLSVKKYVFFSLIFTLIGGNICFAHRVNIFCWSENKDLYCEAKYPSGEKVKKGQVNIIDLVTKKVILSKTTDTKGKVHFILPNAVFTQKHDLEAEILAGMGHRNTWKIPFSDLQEANTENNLKNQASPAETTDVLPWANEATPSNEQPTKTNLSEQKLEKIIDKVMSKKLQPILEKLTLLQEDKITLQDVFAGIGYIFGLMGVAMYFMSKKQS
ncbi:MAG: hypothetical protein Q9M37_00385 [Desulfonauticus sp.]|nr:hypothetical protein [Desulfonauticus sp.]